MTYKESLYYAVIEVTNACNLRCAHCASTSGKKRTNELSLSEIKALVRDVRSLGGEEITIIGGEALLRKDWFDICQCVIDEGMELIFITNGVLFNEENKDKLIKLKPKILGISLDGANKESYQRHRGIDKFDEILNHLHDFVARGLKNVNAITTIMRSNVKEFDEFAKLLNGTNITWQIQLANRGGKRFCDTHFITRNEYKWLVDKVKNAWETYPSLKLLTMDDFGYFPIDPKLKFLHDDFAGCIAGLSLIGVRSNGDLLGCLSLGDDFVEGNIRDESLEVIWRRKDSFPRFRNKKDLLNGQCKWCLHADECRAGCTAVAVSATNDMGDNPYCIRSMEVDSILQNI